MPSSWNTNLFHKFKCMCCVYSTLHNVLKEMKNIYTHEYISGGRTAVNLMPEKCIMNQRKANTHFHLSQNVADENVGLFLRSFDIIEMAHPRPKIPFIQYIHLNCVAYCRSRYLEHPRIRTPAHNSYTNSMVKINIDNM